MSAETLPHGSWPSPIPASLLTAGAAGVGEIRADGDAIWWTESRPSEGGRVQLVRRDPDGTTTDLLAPWNPDGPNANVRTAYLEYGGGAWNVRAGTVVFANWDDQRLHRVDPGGAPVPITPEPETARGHRWSEIAWLDDAWLIAARESHEPGDVTRNGEAVNEIVAVPVDGSAVDDPSRVRVLASGPDFVHTPVCHGDEVAWIAWSHPRMPWDGTELMVGVVRRGADGAPVGIDDPKIIAGGPVESIVAIGFLADGTLRFCTDRDGWWAPHDRARDGSIEPVLTRPLAEVLGHPGEIGGPLWVGGERWWAALPDGRTVATVRGAGRQQVILIDADGVPSPLDIDLTELSQVVAAGSDAVLLVGSSPTAEGAPYILRVPAEGAGGSESPDMGTARVLRRPRELGLDPAGISVPTHHSFESADGRTAHLLHYPPASGTAAAPEGELPPLIVMIHGGPTAGVRHRFDLAKQFWTSRGFAVADVDYGGSVGYGRDYRDLLAGSWGIVDVQDAVAAARYLAEQGLADPERLAIRGGSAGGYTTLAALCFHDAFSAGASHYGIADLSALAADTHKFESRYLDGLIGSWPDEKATYVARSPIHHTEGFDSPLLVLQGSEDAVVPPNQAEMIVDALADGGVPHAYILFEGEQHGFRRAENIVRAIEAELWFYGKVFGFEPDDSIDPVEGAVGL